MKILFTICLIALVPQFGFAQQDTLNLNFRDKEVQVLSDEKGYGSKVITLDDGLRKTKITVDFNAENSVSDDFNSPTENYYVKPRKGFELKRKRKKIYYTFDLTLGNSDFMLFGLESSEPSYSISGEPQITYDRYKNNVLESKYHAISWGLDIPTRFKWLSVKTGIGYTSSKITFDNARFYIRDLGGYSYIASPESGSSIPYPNSQNTYDDYNNYLYSSSLQIPLTARFNLGKKGWSWDLGVENHFTFGSSQFFDKDKQYSLFGIVYKNRPPFPAIFGTIQNNMRRYRLDGTLSLNKGIVGVYAGVNITSFFNTNFYRRQTETIDFKDRPRLLKFGLKLNIW